MPEVLIPQEYVMPWLKLMHHEIAEIREEDSDINPYSAPPTGKFLSVVAEYTSSQPEKFEHNHPGCTP